MRLLASALRWGGQLFDALPDEVATEIMLLSDAACFDPSYLNDGDFAWEFVSEATATVKRRMASRLRAWLASSNN